jgi:hypothetical protein
MRCGLEGGRVVERGPAADLAARGGVFTRMLDGQRARGALADDAFPLDGVGDSDARRP